jgi:hypothetical protein
MWWAKKASWAGPLHTLRTGDNDISSDPKSYTPGNWMDIIIRTHEASKQIAGLVLYAENVFGQKVGEWSVPPRSGFHQPDECVVHSNADQKGYANRFKFRARLGTGAVTIKALVKYGMANPVKDGAFYWPSTYNSIGVRVDQHLVLQEGSPVPGSVWFEGIVGESCDDTCSAFGGTCDLAQLESDATDSSFYNEIKAVTSCTKPLMASCSGASPSISDMGCYYHDPVCPAPIVEEPETRYCTETCDVGWPRVVGDCCVWTQHHISERNKCQCVAVANDQGKVWSIYNGDWTEGWADDYVMPTQGPPPQAEQVSCNTRFESNVLSQRRLCACSGAIDPGITPENRDPDNRDPNERVSSSSKASVFAGSLIACISFLLAPFSGASKSGFSVSKMIFAIMAFGLYLRPAVAHNWMTSPARGNEAGENNGFNGFQTFYGPQRTARIHVQVQAGQKFSVEWASGHGFGSFTYFALSKGSDEALLQGNTIQNLEQYLAEAPNGDTKSYLAEYPAHHVSHEDHKNSLLKEPNIADAYIWIPSMPTTSRGVRPDVFRNFGPSPVVKLKTEAARKDDARARYNNPNFPWLISVSKFSMKYDYPDDADTSMMEVPEGFPPGHYVLHYQWSGYYDVVDVNVLPVLSTDIYGRGNPGGGNFLDRIDHCQYWSNYDGYEITATCTGINPGSNILSSCPCGADCQAIQVIQNTLDERVLSGGVFSNQNKLHLPPSCRDLTTPFVCFGLNPGTPLVGPTYAISQDPEDPVFYNTCFRKSSGWIFDQACDDCPPSIVEPGWIFGQSCLTCAKMRENARDDGTAPSWTFANDNECRDCNE